MTAIKGVGASPGVVLGPWVLVGAARKPEARSIGQSAIPAEIERLAAAAAAAADELGALAEQVRRNGAPAEAAIFGAQALMALDPTLLDAARKRVEGGSAAAPALWAAGEELAGTLRSLDDDLLATCVRETGRVVVVHEAPRTLGIGAEVAARVQELAFDLLEAPVARVTGWDTPYPPAALEASYLPSVDRIADAIRRTVAY